jgi:hypothetical protein
MFLFVSVETSLATKIKRHFQSGPVVVCKALLSWQGVTWLHSSIYRFILLSAVPFHIRLLS